MENIDDIAGRIKAKCGFSGRYIASTFDFPELKGLSDDGKKSLAGKLDMPLSILYAESEFEIPAFMRKSYEMPQKEKEERLRNPEKFYLAEDYIGQNIEQRVTITKKEKGRYFMIDLFQRGKEKFVEILESK